MVKSVRLENDFYPTPIKTLELLLERIDFTKVNSFLEPCSGDDRILNLIKKDIPKYWCEIQKGVNYFDHTFDVDLIITNPPFSISLDFIQKSLKEGKTVCYLQRLNWLGSKKRKDFWNMNTPDKLLILSERPQFKRELGLGTGTDSTEYAWFIWDNLGCVNAKTLEVL